MLGYDLWQRSFGSDPAMIGRRIRIDQQDREVVGIAPRGFRFPPNAPTDLIVPAAVPLAAPPNRRSRGRLRSAG